MDQRTAIILQLAVQLAGTRKYRNKSFRKIVSTVLAEAECLDDWFAEKDGGCGDPECPDCAPLPGEKGTVH